MYSAVNILQIYTQIHVSTIYIFVNLFRFDDSDDDEHYEDVKEEDEEDTKDAEEDEDMEENQSDDENENEEADVKMEDDKEVRIRNCKNLEDSVKRRRNLK